MLNVKDSAMTRKFRTKVAALREKQGVERMDLVRSAGLSYTTVHSWENDLLKSIDAEKISRVMDLLGCESLDDILEIVDDTSD